MDDYLKELFGENNEEPKNETQTPEEPFSAPETTTAPVIPEAPKPSVPAEPEAPKAPEFPEAPKAPEFPTAPIAPEKPAAPEAPTAPTAVIYPEEPKPPVAPAEPKAPAQPSFVPPAEPVNNGFNTQENNYYSPQTGGNTYIPPQTEQPRFIPPVYNPNPQAFNYNRNPVQPPAPGRNGINPPVNTTQPQSPKKKSKGLIVIMVVAIICAAVALFGLWASGSGSADSKNNSSSSSSSADDSAAKEDAQVTVGDSADAAKTDSSGELTVAGVVDKVKDSCVGITVYTEQDAYSYFYNYGNGNNSSGGKTASGEGSGVIMSESGGKTYIMTCAHVIADGSSFTVSLDNDKEYEATLVGYDSQTDIGVLSIEATGLTVAEFGDSKKVVRGEDCIAIGCPGGLTFKNSVTRGIVSGLDVPVSSSIGYSNECIQVDAAINPGNSGGALFNMQGQVIGINSSKIASTDYEGMGFAVPSNTAVETANSLIKNGYVADRARIGISYTTLSNYNSAQSILSALAQQGFDNAEGTMVIQEIENESDLKGKVQQYDMIVAIDGKTLTSVDVLTSVLSKSKPGDTIKLTIARIEGNKINTFDVKCKLIESKGNN